MSRAIERFISASDFHVPYHHLPSLQLFLTVIKDFKPHHIILNGDFLDAEWVSSYPKKLVPNLDQKTEFDLGNDILDAIHAVKPRGSRIILMEGNHENRFFRAGNIPQEYMRLLDPRHWLELERRKIEWLPYDNENGFYQIGDWTWLHGFNHSRHSAAKNAEKYGNCIFGHIHRVQMFSDFILRKTVTAFSPGYMGTPQAYSKQKDKNGHVNGFCFGYAYKSGQCEVHHVRTDLERINILGGSYRI